MSHLNLLALRLSTHMMHPDVASFVKSSEFEKAVRTLDDKADIKAFLMCQLLLQIALDPLSGDKVEHFIRENEEEAWIQIRLDRTTNFIGWFSLPLDHPRVQELRIAIETNLNSRMFKAAKMSRRLDRRFIKIQSIALTRAQEAYRQVVHQCGGQLMTDEQRECANAAFEATSAEWIERNVQRLRAVSKVAHPGFSKGWSEDLANFLYKYLPIY
jgi:hypothetical protein